MKKKYLFCKKQRKESVKRTCMKLRLAAMTAGTYLLLAVPVLAEDEEKKPTDYTGLKIFSGTQKLLAAGTGALTALVAAVTGFYVIKGIQEMQVAPDEEKPKKKKAIVTTLVLGVLGTCASGIVTWILAFYA